MNAAGDFDPPVGIAQKIGPSVQRILAPNPSPMTFRGTNTYLVGDRQLAVIDPGPLDSGHLRAILGTLRPGQQITHILVTHAHLDHSPLAAALSRETGAKIYGYGAADAGRSAVMQRLAERGLVGGGEGLDRDFNPDIGLEDGALLDADGWQLRAHWTPGHLGNHLCFQLGQAVFTGDLVMGWASSLVSPPDGDLTDFMSSCQKLKSLGAKVFHAGHGAPISHPAARLDWLITHRLSRESSILEHLRKGPATAKDLTMQIYHDTPDALIPAATRNVLAHLIDLHGKSRVMPAAELTAESQFLLI
ncbi:MBL fold metallo-hydrolase [Roseovarius aestuarii]|uniref:Hydroxyacylglutathione hydrolase n=1 Tax=Roseovarius aestuarii TaxID=475083 RepID=A0A1X7BUP3_9RHOB|nr:MBL fold metallo-hydrolase [Roseovarius aestuarii]SMC13240.1 Hydroxyacylglutathione hydrolase [Roseovarius aestuarii]